MKKIIIFLTLIFTVNTVSSQDYNSYSTLAHELLELEKNYSDLSEEEKTLLYLSKYKKLDELMEAAQKKFVDYNSIEKLTEQDVINIFKTIDSLLTEHYFLVCITVDRLSEALTPKRLDEFECYKYTPGFRDEFINQNDSSLYFGVDCDLGAILYASIGEILNFPIRIVEIPEHNFVRWEFKDKTYINWDNNSAKVYSDDDFRYGKTPTSNSTFGVKEERLNLYLKSMNKTEFKGYYCSLIASSLAEEGQFLKAEKLFKKAILFRPYDALACNNLSWMYLTTSIFENDSNYRTAYELSLQVNEQLPYNKTFKDTYSCACAAVGEFQDAIRIEAKAFNKKERIEGYKKKKNCLEIGERY